MLVQGDEGPAEVIFRLRHWGHSIMRLLRRWCHFVAACPIASRSLTARKGGPPPRPANMTSRELEPTRAFMSSRPKRLGRFRLDDDGPKWPCEAGPFVPTGQASPSERQKDAPFLPPIRSEVGSWASLGGVCKADEECALRGSHHECKTKSNHIVYPEFGDCSCIASVRSKHPGSATKSTARLQPVPSGAPPRQFGVGDSQSPTGGRCHRG
jgi:hypothetical protein